MTPMAEEEEDANISVVSSIPSAANSKFTTRCTGSTSIIADFTAISHNKI